MLCVGSAGIAWVGGRMPGSTASTVAENAGCTVVIVPRRPENIGAATSDWIVVAVDDRPSNDLVIERAFDEARLRSAPVLVVGARINETSAMSCDELDRRVTRWRRDNPDVHIYPVSTDVGLAQFLTDNPDERAQLAVTGDPDADQIIAVIGRHDPAPHTQCAVMVVR